MTTPFEPGQIAQDHVQARQSSSRETDKTDAGEPNDRFLPEKETDLVNSSNERKAEANALFASEKFDAAITKYDEAVAILPNHLDYELAVLRSNVAACHLKLEQWKEAVSQATAALDALDRIEMEENKTAAEKTVNVSDEGTHDIHDDHKDDNDSDETQEEIVSAGAIKAGGCITTATKTPKERNETPAELACRRRQEDVRRIRAKALMRRSRARSSLGGWSNLEGALEDCKALATLQSQSTGSNPLFSQADQKMVHEQLRALPPRVKSAQKAETAEMWGKLKELGNGLLRPFGLSTDNFQVVKDEKTGGYSMNFQGGSGGK